MTAIEKYVLESWDTAEDYINGVSDGTIICNKYIKLAVQQYKDTLDDPKFELKRGKVSKVFRFFSLLNIPIENDYKQFKLLGYQAFTILNLFGLYYADTDRRKFNFYFLFLGRKNGKTMFASALNLYMLVADGFTDPEVLLLASTTKQANNALKYAKSIVSNSPALRHNVKNMQYKIKYTKGNCLGYMEIFASDNSEKIEGTSPQAAILDEIHSYSDDSVFTAVKTGVGARRNYLITLITTAGYKIDSFCNEFYESSKNVLDGITSDPNTFSLLYMIDEDDQYDDESVWVKANPALGSIIEMDYLRKQFHQTTLIRSTLKSFLVKHLNIWVDTVDSWIDEPALKVIDKGFDMEILKGHTAYAGLDLSSTRDLTSLVLLFYIDNVFYVLPYFFMANNPEKKLRKGGINLGQWIYEEHIIECQTKTIDYELIESKFKELSEEYDIIACGYDSFNSALIIPKLHDLSIQTYVCPQTAKFFNFPLKYVEKQIYDENIVFDGNPAMMWNMRNVVLYSDGNGNIKILKNKSKDSVDGAVSLGMAMAMFININLDEEAAGIQAYIKNNS